MLAYLFKSPKSLNLTLMTSEKSQGTHEMHCPQIVGLLLIQALCLLMNYDCATPAVILPVQYFSIWHKIKINFTWRTSHHALMLQSFDLWKVDKEKKKKKHPKMFLVLPNYRMVQQRSFLAFFPWESKPALTLPWECMNTFYQQLNRKENKIDWKYAVKTKVKTTAKRRNIPPPSQLVVLTIYFSFTWTKNGRALKLFANGTGRGASRTVCVSVVSMILVAIFEEYCLNDIGFVEMASSCSVSG